jgi:hypothetical protein
MNNPIPTTPKPLLSTDAVMKFLGYRSPWGLMRFVRSHGVPFIQLNPCRIMFDEDQLQAWLASRTSPQPPQHKEGTTPEAASGHEVQTST